MLKHCQSDSIERNRQNMNYDRKETSQRAGDDSSDSRRNSRLRQQIALHPGIAIQLGILSGLLIGWWVKR